MNADREPLREEAMRDEAIRDERSREATLQDEPLLDAVERSQERKLRARRNRRPEIARGLGSSGIIGWSVAVPTLVGIAVGVWLDRRNGSDFSWTLVLLAAGLLVGIITAWYWGGRELEDER